MLFETINDYYLHEAEGYRKFYQHLDMLMTPDTARNKLHELGIQDSQFRSNLLNIDQPHGLKALCCIALGTESQTMLRDHNPLNPKVDVILQTGNEIEGWNVAIIMYLMRELH